ncbi:MAG TPA: NUDIX domain-containing protein [Candidatus Saccharimonadales bacterium]|nr:NUDIX domain-containing protein [Candidatus Saccharimonadales bacterium]
MRKVIPQEAVLIPDSAKRVFHGVIYDVYQWSQKMYDESKATFEMLRRSDTVSVIGIVDGNILVLDEEQPHRGSRRSFPGGRVDEEDENTLLAAQRETLEETGYEFKKWKLTQVWQPQTKIEWFIYLFVAWDGAKVAAPHLDGGEKIIVEHQPFGAAKEMVLKREGYLGEAKEILEGVNGIQELLGLPEFKGRMTER